jgi:hypothetical protein
MPGRIGVDLEVVGGVNVLHGLQHLRTQRNDTIVGGHEVLDPLVDDPEPIREGVHPRQVVMTGARSAMSRDDRRPRPTDR